MGFREDIEQDVVGLLELRDAIAIDEHTILRAAIALMRTHSLGCAIIIDQHFHPTGIFTEQSVIQVLVAGASLDAVPVSAFADPDYFVVRSSDPLLKAWNAVVHSGARFVCVTDDSGRLLGLTGQRGLSEYVCDCYSKQIAVQRLGSAPWMLQREGA